MTMPFPPGPSRIRPIRPARALALVLAVAAAALVGCGEKRTRRHPTAPGRTRQITVRQITATSPAAGPLPEQAASATRQALERLIDQELTLQKAGDQ
jgi:hypothetical protein